MSDSEDDNTTCAEEFEKIRANDPNYTHMDVRYRDLGDGGCQKLSKILGSNTHVRELTVTNNNIGDNGCKYLARAFAKNTSLKTVDLSFNDGITDKGAKLLIAGLEKNHTITEIMLHFNEKITPPLKEEIKKILTRNSEFPQRVDSKEKDHKDHKDHHKERERAQTSSKAEKLKKSQSRKRVKEKKTMTIGGESVPEKLALATLQTRLDEALKREKEHKKRIAELEKQIKEGGGVPAVQKKKNKEMTINFDNLLVTEKLAATGGSNAGVYACYVDGWQCAMKELMVSSLKLEAHQINGFESEIGLLESLPHNNHIVKYLHHERTKDKIRLFITKYSSTLRTEIQKRKIDVDDGEDELYSPDEIVSYLLDLVSGLEFLHQQNIIHRDLKSDNVFVTLNERKEIATLAIGDFDTAKALSEEGPAKTLVGTPAYMAPEVLAQNGAYSLQADVYSFGMVIYELLALQMPYSNSPPFKVQANILQGIAPKLPKLDSGYAPIIELFQQCVCMQPHKRPTAQKIKQYLHQVKK